MFPFTSYFPSPPLFLFSVWVDLIVKNYASACAYCAVAEELNRTR